MGEHRFYLPPDRWASPSGIVVDGQEARHMTQALRLRAGEEVVLLDGQGRIGRCRIRQADKKQVLLVLLHEETVPRPTSLPVMALAFSKAVRRGFFMEKAVELVLSEGISSLQRIELPVRLIERNSVRALDVRNG